MNRRIAIWKARFGSLVQWTVFIAGMSLVAHGLIVLSVPQVSSKLTMNRIIDAGGVNAMVDILSSGQNLLGDAFPNLHQSTSVCVFDLSQGPLVLHDSLDTGRWSLSIYTDNRELVYLIDETDVGPGPFKAVLAGTGQQLVAPDGHQIIRIDRFTGLAVIRSQYSSSALSEARRCGTLVS